MQQHIFNIAGIADVHCEKIDDFKEYISNVGGKYRKKYFGENAYYVYIPYIRKEMLNYVMSFCDNLIVNYVEDSKYYTYSNGKIERMLLLYECDLKEILSDSMVIKLQEKDVFYKFCDTKGINFGYSDERY